MGWLSDYLGARVSIWLALICQGLALLLFSLANAPLAAVLAGCLYGFGYSACLPWNLRHFQHPRRAARPQGHGRAITVC